MATDVAIIGMGTALPQYPVTQNEAGQWVVDDLDDLDYPSRTKRYAGRTFRRSTVATRYSVLPDFTCPEEATLYRVGLPTLDERIETFRTETVKLAERACLSSFAEAGVVPADITHLVVVTSTGFFTPGPDWDLVVRLGLSDTVERTVVSMSGCSGAFTGLRLAKRIVGDEPASKVLMVCVELSSIHLDDIPDDDKIVAFSIFGDASAATVVTGVGEEENPAVVLGNFQSQLDIAGRELLKWDLNSTGFSITLSDELVPFLRERVSSFCQPLVASVAGDGREPRDVQSGVVHPGGPSILRNVQIQLDLKPDALETSWEVLRDGSNLSSVSVHSILDKE